MSTHSIAPYPSRCRCANGPHGCATPRGTYPSSAACAACCAVLAANQRCSWVLLQTRFVGDPKLPAYAWAPFSAGVHKCSGYPLAQVSIAMNEYSSEYYGGWVVAVAWYVVRLTRLCDKTSDHCVCLFVCLLVCLQLEIPALLALLFKRYDLQVRRSTLSVPEQYPISTLQHLQGQPPHTPRQIHPAVP